MLYMWTYVVDAVSETVWGTIDPTTDAYQEAANWTGVLYAIQAMGSVARLGNGAATLQQY